MYFMLRVRHDICVIEIHGGKREKYQPPSNSREREGALLRKTDEN